MGADGSKGADGSAGAGLGVASGRRRRPWALVVAGVVTAIAGLVDGSRAEAQEQAAAGQVGGVVTAAEDGRPLAGIDVAVKGSDIRTLTNTNGRYSLVPPSPEDTLVFASIGFQSLEVAIDGQSVVNASLASEAIALQEIVATGYGVQQRRDVTGAIASVTGEELAEVTTASVQQALQGRVAGVQVNAISGAPGEQAVVRIRGVGTLNNASPLYVVDGMLLDDIAFLDPSDIASAEVLKDASATAIYGSRGSNGVIIVTTRRGAIDRPTQFRLSAYTGAQRVLNPIELVNAREYAMLANELAANQGQPDPYFGDPDAVGPGTDWQREIFQTAPMSSVQLSSQGGTDRITYYFSANYVDQAGVIPKSDYARLTLRLNNDYQLTDRFRLGHNINFAHEEGERAPGVLGDLYRADPTITPRNDDGEFNDANLRASAGNASARVFYTNNTEDGNRLVGNLFADVDLFSGLSLRSSFGLDYDRETFREFTPEFSVSPTQQNQISDLLVKTYSNSSWLWENTVTFRRATAEHQFDVLAGITIQSFSSDSLGGTRTNIAGDSENLWYLNAGDAESQTNFNGSADWKMLSYLFRTNYTFLDRYLLTGSLRVDGSSRFGRENRYGYFPSFALGWNLAEESFLRDARGIDALKLRASWGKIGNDKIGEYPAIAVVDGNLNAVFGPDESLRFGASPVSLANPEVRWEQTSQTNVGLDAALFGGQVEATFDYYRRLTDGILVQVPIPGYVGVGNLPFVNAAEVLNSGFEGSLTWAGNVGGLGFQLGANGSTVKNEVRSLGEGQEEILGGGWGNEISFSTRTVVGEPVGSFWGFEVDGVFQTEEEIASSPTRGGEAPGDLKYADLNGRDPVTGELTGMPDGVITNDDKTFLGSPIPDFIYGFNARFTYGGFDLSAGFAGQSGNKVFNAKKAVRFGVETFERSYLDRWTGPGTSNTEPRVTNAGHNYQASEYFLEDGSFLKLHSAQLGYELPQNWVSGLSVARARLYVSGTNLFIVSDYPGYTPEVVDPNASVINSGIDLGLYPPARTLTFGVDVSF
ncbi:MAG: SusC/RagA family TonB-linked outer membrane protein [Longimicrobiales bacterium]